MTPSPPDAAAALVVYKHGGEEPKLAAEAHTRNVYCNNVQRKVSDRLYAVLYCRGPTHLIVSASMRA